MHRLLADPRLGPWLGRYGRGPVHAAAQRVLEGLRAELARGAPPRTSDVVALVQAELERATQPALRPVINATGTVLHTGLGRAPLAAAAAAAVLRIATGYSNLELDLGSGERGSRHSLVAGLLRELTGAEDAVVVNNNAAAVLLLLAALGAGREVVVSRGELVEIGGSFRVPEVMAQSGALLREVGTTNRTYARDYRAAVSPQTALLLKVHQSNFLQIGFTASPTLEELVAVGRECGVPVAFDMGSGALLPDGVPGHQGERDVRSALASGVDVVTFSGDKLLGGPQAGILCGRAGLLQVVAAHPLARAVRVDKMTLAALEATLSLYAAGRAEQEVPALVMLARTPADLERAAGRLARRLRTVLGETCQVDVEASASLVGAGALPGVQLPTAVVTLRPRDLSVQSLAGALRAGSPPVVARVRDQALLLDPRTIWGSAQERQLPGLISLALARASAEAT